LYKLFFRCAGYLTNLCLIVCDGSCTEVFADVELLHVDFLGKNNVSLLKQNISGKHYSMPNLNFVF